MPLKDEQVPELHGKMPNVISETVEKSIVFGGFTATAGCYCHLLPCYLCTKRSCRQQDALPPTPTCEPHQQQKHLPTAKHPATEGRTSARITTKSTCRQQNTMPLSSEVLLLLLAATATCYLLLVTKSSCRQQDALPRTPTCEPHQQQKHLPTAKHPATEGRTSARITTKSTCRQQTPCH